MSHDEHSPHGHRPAVAAAVAAACFAGPLAAAGGALATASPAPTPHAAQVIASQIADLTAGSHHWSIGGGEIDPAEPAPPPPPAAATFVVATGGTVVAADSAGSPVGQLGVGEALPLPPGDVSLFAAGDHHAAFVGVQLVAGDPSPEQPDFAASFPLGAGFHDVDLARAVLAPDEVATVAGSGAPLLVVITGGTVEVAGETLTQGDARALVGDIEVDNAGDAEATFVAAVVAPLADVLADETAGQTTPPSSSPATTSPPPPTELAEQATTTETPSAPVPTTGEFGQDGTVSVSFSPSSPPPGGTIEVTGSGCEPGETVRVGTWRTSGGGDVETTTQADADGSFATTTTIPADHVPGDQFGVLVDCGVGEGELASDGRFAIAYGDTGAGSAPATEAEAPPEDADPAVPTTGEFGQDGTVSVSFNPSGPPPGGTIEVTGSGCEPGETVRVGTWRTSGGGTVDTTTQAGADGSFATATTIPADLVPGDQFGVRVDCGVGEGELASDGRFAIAYGVAAPTDGDSDGAVSDSSDSALTGTWRNILRQTGISEIFYISTVTIEPVADHPNEYTVTHRHDCLNDTVLLAVYELTPTGETTWEEGPQPVETSGDCETSSVVDVSFEYTGPVVWTLEASGRLERVAPILSHPNEVEFDDVSVWERVDDETSIDTRSPSFEAPQR
ncbi:MAG: hypothetical protein ACRD0G_12440 [Acidimicrobiales bacterium]